MIWIIGAPVLCFAVCLPFFMYYKSRLQYVLASMYKSSGTLCALIPALVAAIRLDPRCWVCVAAVVLHAVADFILEFRMMAGMAVFMAGHICYIAFFTRLVPVSAVHLICLVCLLAVMVFAFWKNRKAMDRQLLPFSVYGVVLSVMAACAVGCMSAGTVRGVMIAAGGAFFVVSDLILFHRLLYPSGKAVSWIIMITYYTAQLLFGISCLYTLI